MRKRSKLLSLAAALLAAALSSSAVAWLDLATTQAISDAITEIEVDRARQMLESVKTETEASTFQRARLAVYVGDCDSADAILKTLARSKEVDSLARLASSCSRAVAGSLILQSKKHGVWLRLQDQEDRALAPFIYEVAAKSRDAIEKDLGVHLPRPLRIDLVRDLFSLSAVSGLPVTAAETTGTVAVARWGRVTILTPRAAAEGYPWEDTLAHEITHLVVSRATRDRAPLWLQEGLAKREESRWRKPTPSDQPGVFDDMARRALLNGTSVGVDQLGPSIAMLPTPAAASTAFAEVTSFVEYWVEQNGRDALTLLLADLKGLRTEEADAALRSVSGHALSGWLMRWKHHLLDQADKPNPNEIAQPHSGGAVRPLRLGELLTGVSEFDLGAAKYSDAVDQMPKEAGLRYRAAHALLAAKHEDAAREQLGAPSDVSGLNGDWFALHGYFLRSKNQAGADRAFALGRSVNPLSEVVACQGVSDVLREQGVASVAFEADSLRDLCEAARRVPREPTRPAQSPTASRGATTLDP